MMDQYLTELVKEAKVQNKLDSHLEELVKTAEAEVELESFMDKASAAELAKLAGVELPEGFCPQCASEMQKLGSVYQCPCGMTKKAVYGARMATEQLARSIPRARRMLSGAPQTMEQMGAPLLEAGGQLGSRELASVGRLRQIAAALKSKLPARPAPAQPMPPLEGMAVTAAKKLPPELVANAVKTEESQDPDDPGAEVPETSGTEEIRGSKNKEGVGPKCASELEKDAFLGQALRNLGGRIAGSGFGKWVGGTGVGKAVGGKAQQVAQTYSKARGLSGVGTYGPQMQGGQGVGGALWQTAKAHPGVATGMVGVPLAAGGGYALSKRGSAELTEVGDAAGRIMAKMAVRLTPEEVGEAIEAAKAREDIPGRATSWGRRGAALGGLGGAALGGGIGRLAGGKGALLAPALGAAAGGVGGGLLGHRVGREEGAEEAAADRLVSMLRGRRAYMAGGQRGYIGGLRRGYAAGRAAGGPGPQ